MVGKRRPRIGQLGKTDWGTAFDSPKFGGSGRSASSGRDRSRSQRSGREHKWCEDCSDGNDATGKCVHCKNGRFPLPNGRTTGCRKCNGDGKCHACRGSRLNGRKCSSPTYEEAAEKQRAARKSGGWQSGGSVDGSPARTRQRGARTDALWGGTNPRGDGEDHGHIVSSDGINADYVAYPGGEVVVDNDNRRADPYKPYERKRRR